MDYENDDENDQSRPYSIYEDTSSVHHKINPDCPICSKPIFWSKHILSLGRVWHLQCFICSFCFKSLKPGEQSYYAGRLFCTEPCFNKLFLGHYTTTKNVDNSQVNRLSKDANTLAHNGQLVNRRTTLKTNEDTTKIIDKFNLTKELIKKSNDNKTDPKQTTRLNCTNCEKSINKNPNHRLIDKCPYNKVPGCKIHTELNRNRKKSLENNRNQMKNSNKLVQLSDFIGKPCIRCSKKVYAAELCYSINLPLHSNCLKCSICNRMLQPAVHAVHDGLPICNSPCYNRICSLGGYRKGWQECRP